MLRSGNDTDDQLVSVAKIVIGLKAEFIPHKGKRDAKTIRRNTMGRALHDMRIDIFPPGFAHYPLYFDLAEQAALIEAVRSGVKQAPFFQPTMPKTGKPVSMM